MEEPITPTGASDPAPDPALAPVNQAVDYAGGPLSREDVAGMIRAAADYCGITLTDHQCRQLAGSPHAAAKAHGNWRYARGYAHGRSDFERGEPVLPDVDDPRDEQTEKIALAIRAVAERSAPAEVWAEGLYDCGIRAIDLPGGSSDESGQVEDWDQVEPRTRPRIDWSDPAVARWVGDTDRPRRDDDYGPAAGQLNGGDE